MVLYGYVLVGLPGAGKSSFIDAITVKPPFKNPTITCSTDNYIQRWADEAGITYTDQFNVPGIYDKAMELVEQDYALAVLHQKHIFWDQTNLRSDKRKKLITKFAKDGYTPVAIEFCTPWETIMERWEARKAIGKVIPLQVMETMKNMYQPVLMSEGFEYIQRVYPDRVVTVHAS